MKRFIYGLLLFAFLAMPPIVSFLESHMLLHMHVQMPLLAFAGMLWTPFLQAKFPRFFSRWNEDGVPGIVLVSLVVTYWILPRAMDEAIQFSSVEVFKFISWPFFVGVAMKDSWKKLKGRQQLFSTLYFSFIYGVMGFVYIFAEEQLCNNYLIVEQRLLGWSFLAISLGAAFYRLRNEALKKRDAAAGRKTKFGS